MMSIPNPAAFARWPDVPACYGWLSLDRRGVWRLQGEPVGHAGLVGFLNAGYGCDEVGNWLVHNGPQRVYVALEYTPWVLRLHPDGSLTTHTGADAGAADAVHLDEDGGVLLHTAPGIGVLDDRDLATFLAECKGADGSAADEEVLLGVMAGGSGVVWRGLPLQAIARAMVAARYGFRDRPEP